MCTIHTYTHTRTHMNLHISSMHECVRAHTVTVRKWNCTQGREIIKLLWSHGNATEVWHERPSRDLSGTSFSTGLLLHPRLNWSRRRTWASRSCEYMKWNLCPSCFYGYLQKLFILNYWTVVYLGVYIDWTLSLEQVPASMPSSRGTYLFQLPSNQCHFLASQSLFSP